MSEQFDPRSMFQDPEIGCGVHFNAFRQADDCRACALATVRNVLEKTGAKSLAVLFLRHAAMGEEWREQIAASIRSGEAFTPPDGTSFADQMEEMRDEMHDIAERLAVQFGFLDEVPS